MSIHTYSKVSLHSVDHAYHSTAIIAPVASSPILIGWPHNRECKISRLLHEQDELPQDTTVNAEDIGYKNYYSSQVHIYQHL